MCYAVEGEDEGNVPLGCEGWPQGHRFMRSPPFALKVRCRK
jgi:hypothetical protein